MYLPKMGATSATGGFAPATYTPAQLSAQAAVNAAYNAKLTAGLTAAPAGYTGDVINTGSGVFIAPPAPVQYLVSGGTGAPSGAGNTSLTQYTPTPYTGASAGTVATPLPMPSAPGMVTPNQVFGPSIQSVDSGSVPDLNQSAVTPVQTPTLSDGGTNWLLWAALGLGAFLIFKRA
jgi:hypothetical protein